MNNSAVLGQFKRSALGRLAFLGELYDARTESFSSRKLFKQSLPPNLIKVTDIHQTDFQYLFTENVSDRFDLLDVQGELQVAVLLGLIELDGSGKFLTDTKKSDKGISCSLLCKIQTLNEKLMASFDEILPHIDLTGLDQSQYTHVVVEVNWGANCLLSLEASCSSDSKKEEVKGRLGSEFSLIKKILSVKGDGELKNAKSISDGYNNLNIRVRADVVPEDGWPTTVEGFCTFMDKVPKLLKNMNDGKGKPLGYFMIPLSEFQKAAKLQLEVETELINIDNSFLTSIILFFEDVARIKQRFQDLVTLINDNSKFVQQNLLKDTREKQKEFSVKESELKCLLCEEWVPVRSGKQNMKDLIRRFEQFKSRHFNLFAYEEFLELTSSISAKLSTVECFVSQGVVYLGVGDNFAAVQRSSIDSSFIVMVTSTEMEKADPELYRKTSTHFITLVNERRPDTVYVVVDFDYCDKDLFGIKIDRVSCLHLKGAQVLSADLLAEYLADCDTNFARLISTEKLELCKHKPGNRVILKMPCPGYKSRNCPTTDVEWKCSVCRNNIEYGFDKHFYCTCGKAAVDSFVYHCKDPKHGTAFVPAPSELLRITLSELRPLKELNLLVIGQSGVGKSTWINSIINYLTYDTLDAAKEFGAVVVIPAVFPMVHPKTSEMHMIRVGEESDNEVTKGGNSATQYSRTYTFLWEERCVRIIDTPGLGDTRGIDQDKENLKNVVHHISHLKELHGVCILFKASDNRLNSYFAYCVKELLVHLHKSVVKNIVFCFTNARTSFYGPGAASTVLENLFNQLRVEGLSLGPHNRFCLDNEAFLFLCALENGMTFDDGLVESYKKSWEISLKETRRLFQAVKDYRSHDLKETLSLVTARFRVLCLTKPLAEVSKTIQVNLNTCNRKKVELSEKNLSVEELQKKLTLTEIKLEPVDLKKPRTVCTSPECVTYHSYKSSSIKEIEYTTHCHVECYLENVTPKTVNNPLLKGCTAMDSSGKCQVCGCSWANHMHLTYSQKRVEYTVIDKTVQTNLEKEKTEKEILEDFMKDVEEKIEKYKKEEQVILEATSKFAIFLKRNAITVYNDSLEEYLLYLIKEEEDKPHKSAEELAFLDSLKDTLKRYRAEVEILTAAVSKAGNVVEEITPEKVYEIEQKLYGLELMGSTIRNFVNLSQCSSEQSQQYYEQPVQIAKSHKKGEKGPSVPVKQPSEGKIQKAYEIYKTLKGMFM